MESITRELDSGPFSRIRRNHALEHATLQVLAEKIPGLRMAGYSDQRGFWLIGQVETSRIQEAAEEALARLKSGEASLAIHPRCGTHLVATSLMAGSFACWACAAWGGTSASDLNASPLSLSWRPWLSSFRSLWDPSCRRG